MVVTDDGMVTVVITSQLLNKYSLRVVIQMEFLFHLRLDPIVSIEYNL